MGHQRDWFNEQFRRRVWPKLHPLLQRVGGYAIGVTPENQLAAVFEQDIEEVEHQVMHSLGFGRNNIACLKHRETGEWSDGSWVWRPDGWLSEMQLHITLYDGIFDGEGMAGQSEVTTAYAHWEDNYWVSPFDHLDGANFQPREGVRRFQEMLDEAGVDYITVA